MPGNSHKQENKYQQDLFEAVDVSDNSRDQKHYAVMNCDGASSGNPGEAGIGVVIQLSDEDARRMNLKKTYTISASIGIATNNVAEYSALIKGLEKAKSLGLKKIKIFLDSELLVRQLLGIYKVKNKNLIPLWIKAKNILTCFDKYTIDHVRRGKNAEADELARQGVKKKNWGY